MWIPFSHKQIGFGVDEEFPLAGRKLIGTWYLFGRDLNVFTFLSGVTSSADGATAEVAAVADDSSVVIAAADREAVQVDAVAVPVVGDAELDGTVTTGDSLGENTSGSIGAVHVQVGEVVAVGTDRDITTGDGDVDGERIVEARRAKLHLGEVTLGEGELGEVDGGGTRGVGMDEAPVFDDEDVALGHLFALGHLLEANRDGIAESTSQRGDGSEASLHKQLSLGEVVRASALFARHRTHDGFALPERANDGADFAGETVKDAFLNFTHSCKSFELVIE